MRPLVLATLLVASLSSAPGSAMADHDQAIFADFPELSEFGYFVVINGDEYWAPHAWRCEGDWAPYARGYLYEDAADGLVWVSNDPWGFITEHYGYWRHHEQYGYVWRPIYPLQWRPYVASMFHDRRGAIIGWTPFYAEVWDHGYYRFGFGFDDCYWAPYWSRVHYGDFYYHHYPRFSGWHVSVTFYDYDVYYRTTPDHCYRRDWEYRDHHERKRHDSGIPPYRFREGRGAKRAEQPTARRREDAPAATVDLGRTVSIPPRNVEVSRQRQENRERTVAPRFGTSRVKLSEVQRQASSRAAEPARQAAQQPRRERGLDVVQPRQEARPSEPVSREPSRATVEPRRVTLEARQPRAESRQAPEARETQPTRRAPEWRGSQHSRPAREVQASQPLRQGREVQASQPSRPRHEAQVSQPSRQVDRGREARSSQAEESRSRQSSAPAERVKAAFESRGKNRKGQN